MAHVYSLLDDELMGIKIRQMILFKQTEITLRHGIFHGKLLSTVLIIQFAPAKTD